MAISSINEYVKKITPTHSVVMIIKWLSIYQVLKTMVSKSSVNTATILEGNRQHLVGRSGKR